MLAITNGIRTYRYTDDDSCQHLGLKLAIPRSKNHFNAMLNKFGSNYFSIVPGIYGTAAGNYTGYSMKSGSVPNWYAIDGKNWWLRDTTFSEPNGDYTPGCWLSMYGYDVNGLQFNDGNCNYSSINYICSTNDKF